MIASASALALALLFASCAAQQPPVVTGYQQARGRSTRASPAPQSSQPYTQLVTPSQVGDTLVLLAASSGASRAEIQLAAGQTTKLQLTDPSEVWTPIPSGRNRFSLAARVSSMSAFLGENATTSVFTLDALEDTAFSRDELAFRVSAGDTARTLALRVVLSAGGAPIKIFALPSLSQGNATQIAVNMGSTFEVYTTQWKTSGYSWELVDMSSSPLLSFVAVGERSFDVQPGTAETKSWRLQAKPGVAGKERLVFDLVRFGRDVERSVAVEVDVRAA